MSENVRYEFDVPSEVHLRLVELQTSTGLTTTELLIGASEVLFNHPTQATMKRVARVISARRFEAIIANFPARHRSKKGEGNEQE